VARILHLADEALTIIMLTAASALARSCSAWLTVCIVRWRNRGLQARRQITLRHVPFVSRQEVGSANGNPDCLACGNTGTVMRAISGSRYQSRPCPACEPAQRTG
jgi:hypothetical protein